MKPCYFLGDSLERLREFPKDVQQDAGYQLELVRDGQQPEDRRAWVCRTFRAGGTGG